LTSLARVGIEHPFPIQTLCLPLALAGVDLIGQARTGTGKTLAFGIPIVQEVEPELPEVQALVLVPTRELCLQVAGDIDTAGRDAGVRAVAIVGGRPLGPQIVALNEGAQVVVGTPGRVLDHLRQGHLKLDKVRILVVDEADEMLDLGFLPDVETIISATPEHRQTMLFSATMPKAVVALARRYAKRPTFVHAEPEGSHATVPATRQLFFQVHPLNRFQVLCRILDAPDRDRVAVFRRTKRGVDRTIKGLLEEGYRAGALHGDMPQVVREKVMRSFRKGKLDVLVCTDVASRGRPRLRAPDRPDRPGRGRRGRGHLRGLERDGHRRPDQAPAGADRRARPRDLLHEPAAERAVRPANGRGGGHRPGRGRARQGRAARQGRDRHHRGAGPPPLPLGRPPPAPPPHPGRRAPIGGDRLGNQETPGRVHLGKEAAPPRRL
jgi:hypothetical protein